jgi:hypothetical protein
VRNDIEIVKRELPADLVEFFVLTPVPGSEDHRELWNKGVHMDADLNDYDGEHVVTAHGKMTRSQWQRAYEEAWLRYYTPEHIETVLRRAHANGVKLYMLLEFLLLFSFAIRIEKLHPLQSGILRLRHPSERRPGLPVEPAWRFYPTFFVTTLINVARLATEFAKVLWIYRRVKNDSNARSYTDQAMTTLTDADEENLQIYTNSEAARDAVRHARKIKELTAGVA